MAASGLIYALMADDDVVWVLVRDGQVIDARGRRLRIAGACPWTAWRVLERQAVRMEWIPDDSRQKLVRRVTRRAASAATGRLRRAHQRLAPPAAA